MATLDLGKIKFVWKGVYAGGTTYEVDDVVSYQGSSYIYKNATSASGNLPTVTTHWDLLAQGSDLSALTAQGQIPYRGASGVVALAPSTSGFVLRTNGAGQNPSWDSLESSLDPATRTARFHFPKQGYSCTGDIGGHLVSVDGRVYFGGQSGALTGGVSSATDSTVPSGPSNITNTPARHAVLPRGAKAHKVFDFNDASFVIDSNGNVYGAGVNAQGQLGLGLLANGPAGANSNDTTNRGRYTQLTFPTHNYPQIGSSETPKIVHIFNGNQENHSSSNRIFAIDTHGFLWTWGDNTSNQMGIGTSFPAIISTPVRIPTFMATASVSANATINQPAASGTRKRVKKVTAIANTAETFALVEKDDTNIATESGVFFWGNNTGCTATGNNTATTYSLPQQFSRAALGLDDAAGEWVVDIFANSARADAAATGTFTILTNTGRMLTCGVNTYGVLANGSATNNFGTLSTITTSTVGGGAWAVPATWTPPAGMTNANFNVQWTGATFDAQIDSLDELCVFSGTFRYAKTANNYWCFWGTQDIAATSRGLAGVGNNTTATYFQPTQLMFRDGQHEENVSYRTATDEFGSSQLTTGNALGFTISKVRHVGGMWNDAVTATNLSRAVTLIIMSNGRVYMTGTNAQGQAGTGDAFSSTGFFRRVRLDDPINNEGSIVDARVVRGNGTTIGTPAIRVLFSNGDVYAWGFSASGVGFLGANSFVPCRVHLGGIVY
jgi:hypothetical protein